MSGDFSFSCIGQRRFNIFLNKAAKNQQMICSNIGTREGFYEILRNKHLKYNNIIKFCKYFLVNIIEWFDFLLILVDNEITLSPSNRNEKIQFHGQKNWQLL